MTGTEQPEGASPAPIEERAAEHLERLGRILAFDASWVAVRDPERRRYVPLATSGAAAPLHDYFSRPDADEELEMLGLNRRRPPMLASEIPVRLSEVRAWADHLLPAGFREGLAAPLFTGDGRHVGSLGLLSADPSRPNRADRSIVAAVATVIADDLDRARHIAETARILGKARAGILLTRGGDVLPLPGLPDDRLLAPGAPLLAVAADEVARGGAYASFLAPAPGAAGRQLTRVVALDFARPELDHLSAAVLLAPPGDLRGLSRLDLRLLGLLVEGRTDIPALARSLHVAPATVTASLERCQVALRTTDVTAAAVRALRDGLRIPPGVTGAR